MCCCCYACLQYKQHYLEERLGITKKDGLLECDCRQGSTRCSRCTAHYALVAELAEGDMADIYLCASYSSSQVSTPRDSSSDGDDDGESSRRDSCSEALSASAGGE